MKKYLFISLFCFVFVTVSVFSASNERDSFITHAKTYVGTPYRYGGTTRTGVDCSGFIYIVALESLNMKLPRTVIDLMTYSKKVSNSALQPGDLVFFNTVGNKPSHIGIYLGNTQFIHSASDGPNTGVIVSSLNESYWSRTYIGGGKIFDTAYEGTTSNIATLAQEGQGRTKQNEPADAGNFFTSFSLNNVHFVFSSSLVWNFAPANSFFFNIRGGTLEASVYYDFGALNPGFGFSVRFDPQIGITQIPLLFSLSVGTRSVTRFFIGPVFTLGTPETLGNNAALGKSPFFPGIIGFEWQTPPLISYKKSAFSVYQNVSYTMFADDSGNALPLGTALATGFLLSTGIRVTL